MADYSVTLAPFLSGIEQAQQRRNQEEDRAFQRWQRDQTVQNAQSATDLDAALGKSALAKITAMQQPTTQTVTQTVAPPPPSPIAAVRPQMNTPEPGSPFASVVAKGAPQASEWVNPVTTQSQVTTPGAKVKNADAIQAIAGIRGGGKIAYEMAGKEDAAAASARANFYRMLHEAKSPADVEIAVQLANESGAGIPANMVKDKKFQAAIVQAGTVAHQLGNKDGAFKAVLDVLMKGGDAAAVISQFASGKEGVKPHGQPFVGKDGNYYFLGVDGQTHRADFAGEPIGAGSRPRAGGGVAGGGKAARVSKTFMDQGGNWWSVMSDGTSKPINDAAGKQIRGAQNEGIAARYAKMYQDAGTMGDDPSKVDAAIRAGRAAVNPGGTPAATGQNALPPGVPVGAKKVGTKGGKPVYEWNDAVTGKTKRAVIE